MAILLMALFDIGVATADQSERPRPSTVEDNRSERSAQDALAAGPWAGIVTPAPATPAAVQARKNAVTEVRVQPAARRQGVTGQTLVPVAPRADPERIRRSVFSTEKGV